MSSVYIPLELGRRPAVLATARTVAVPCAAGAVLMVDGRRRQHEPGIVDAEVRANRAVWEVASQKYVREYDDFLAQAASGALFSSTERALLHPVLRCSPEVVHLQSGHGLEDVALVRAGARSVLGIDYSHGCRCCAAPSGRTRRRLPVRCGRRSWRAAGQCERRSGVHGEGCPDVDARPRGVGSRGGTPAAADRVSVHFTRRIRRRSCGRGTRTGRASGRTAVTSAAAMSTTRSRLAGRWNGSGPSATSSPLWQQPAWRLCISASTRNLSGVQEVSPQPHGAVGCPTPLTC